MTDLVTLAECPPGVFEFEGSLGFKTEYGATLPVPPHDVPGSQVKWQVTHWPEAYCLESGEAFWGGTKTQEDKAQLLVRPMDEMAIVERVIDRMGWDEIHAFQEHLGQDVREDAGGLMLRKIKRLFGIRRDTVQTYQDAARAMLKAVRDNQV
jgi:hypothetical protein